MREGFLGHACQAAQKLLCPVEMFMEGEGGWKKPGFGGRDGTELEEQWDLEPSLIYSPQIPEVGREHSPCPPLHPQRSPGTSDAEARMAPLRVTGEMAMEKRR